MQYQYWDGGISNPLNNASISTTSELKVKPSTSCNKKKAKHKNYIPPHLQNLETKKTELHVQFLEGVLNVLKYGYKVIKFIKPINQKDMRFFKITLRCFNRRTRVGLSSDKERELVAQILNELTKKSDVVIDFFFEFDFSALVLTIVPKNPKLRKKTDIEKKLGSLKFKIAKMEGHRPKSIHKISIKVYVLEIVLKFVQSGQSKLEIDDNFRCETELFSYMKRVCETVNGDETCNWETKYERGMVEGIKTNLEGRLLEVQQSQHFLIFTKLSPSGEPISDTDDATAYDIQSECDTEEEYPEYNMWQENMIDLGLHDKSDTHDKS